MILQAKNVHNWIKQKQHTNSQAVLFYGSNQGLALDFAQALRHAILEDDSDDPFVFVPLQGETLTSEPQLLLSHAYSIALNGKERLIWVKNGGDFLHKPMQTLLKATKKANTIIITCSRLDKRSSLRQLFEQEKRCAIVPCYSEYSHQTIDYIRHLLHHADKSMDHGTLQFLTAFLGEERHVTKREVEKMVLYVGNKRHITYDDCVACLRQDMHALTAQTIAFHIGKGDVAQTNALLDKAQEQAMPLPMLMRSTGNHFMRLYQCLSMMDAGTSRTQAMMSLRPPVFFQDKQAFEEQLSRWSSTNIMHAIARLTQGEITSKSGGYDAHETKSKQILLGIARLAQTSAARHQREDIGTHTLRQSRRLVT
ncbi:MAG: DNA polymerase III subunit delta [Alphaproteobacteria bacterium GM7ARS4]|nr:DNA polymerase III subunit delta [Alphaproteobacteria bacterium GM7ARS4]